MNKATKVILGFFVMAFAFATTISAQNTLFISEYLEGSSNNKAMEIYNPTDASVDLSGYALLRANNGSATTSDTLALTGTLAPGEVFVVANPSAIAGILAVADTTHSITFYNGNDFVGLYQNVEGTWTLIDTFGVLGEDSVWDVAGVTGATNEQTLVRKPTIMTGQTDWALSAGTDSASSEWLVYAQNDTTFLGSHTVESATPEAVSVTFNVNTATMPDTMMTDHFLQIRGGVVGSDEAGTGLGSMITWDAASLAATNMGGDYWTVSFDMSPGDTLNYKWWAGVDSETPLINGSEQGWESGDNNQFILPSDAVGDTVAPLNWYETRQAPFTSDPDSINVYFRVNIGRQAQLGNFDPETEIVSALGGGDFFPSDWSSPESFVLEQLPNPTGDNLFYGGALKFPKDSVATVSDPIFYKFVYQNADGSIGWESDPNRDFSVPDQDTTLHWDFFSREAPTSGNIVETGLNFEVNVGILEGLGYFNSSLDSVYVTGTFNSWTNTGNQMQFNDVSGNYEALNIPLTTTPGSQVDYKYYIRWDGSRDDETSENYFPGIRANDDGWEEPAVTGGGNRVFNIEDAEQQPTRSEFFNGVEPQAIMTPNNVEGGAIDVTFSIDMTPATEAETTPFRPGTDSVFLSLETPFFALTQGITLYGGSGDNLPTSTLEERDRIMFTDENSDGVYELTLPLQLPTLNHPGFNITYGEPTSATGTIITSGPGGTEAGRRFYQFVQPMVAEGGAVTWPSSFAFPTLTWTKDALPYEDVPDYTMVDNEVEGTVAESFQLMQNYPNPFNPTTNITFNLPSASKVKLAVYNVLGQEVATLVNKTMTAGAHTVGFDASQLSSGMYIYRIEAGDFISTKKMMLIK